MSSVTIGDATLYLGDSTKITGLVYDVVLTSMPIGHSAWPQAIDEQGRRPVKDIDAAIAANPQWQTIYDPFMGRGGYGLSTLKAGRKFIGVEIDPTAFEEAVRLLTNFYTCV